MLRIFCFKSQYHKMFRLQHFLLVVMWLPGEVFLQSLSDCKATDPGSCIAAEPFEYGTVGQPKELSVQYVIPSGFHVTQMLLNKHRDDPTPDVTISLIHPPATPAIAGPFQGKVEVTDTGTADTRTLTLKILSVTDDDLDSYRLLIQYGGNDVFVASATIMLAQTVGGNNNTDISISAVVGGVGLLAIIGVAVVVVRRRKSAKRKPAENSSNNMELDQVSTSGGTYEDVKTPSEFPRSQLDIKEELGQGEFGTVYKAEALKISGSAGTTVVAARELKGMASPASSAVFIKEQLSVLKHLGTHPNVVSFLGYCTDMEPFYLLLEFVSGGSLQSSLRTSRSQQTYGNLHGGSKSLSSRDLTKFAWDVAKGMSFLSSKKILHRDLATRNVLVSADRTCKVSDFGFSREGDEYEGTTKTRLPVRWMAPESLFHRKYTTKSDVWAFGVLLWEIVTLGATPYPGMSKQEVMEEVQQGHRMSKPHHCDDRIYSLMQNCWNEQPTERPDFPQLEEALDLLMEDEHDYIDLAYFDGDAFASLQTTMEEKY